MLGAFGVGKTSLVARFVHSAFSDKYLSTIGVKIDKKVVAVDGWDLTLVLWDLAGETSYEQINTTYIRGASAYILVVDGTRISTMLTAKAIHSRVQDQLGALPFVIVINKADVRDRWEVADGDLEALASGGWPLLVTSAKSGDGVEDLFIDLARKLMQPSSNVASAETTGF